MLASSNCEARVRGPISFVKGVYKLRGSSSGGQDVLWKGAIPSASVPQKCPEAPSHPRPAPGAVAAPSQPQSPSRGRRRLSRRPSRPSPLGSARNASAAAWAPLPARLSRPSGPARSSYQADTWGREGAYVVRWSTHQGEAHKYGVRGVLARLHGACQHSFHWRQRSTPAILRGSARLGWASGARSSPYRRARRCVRASPPEARSTAPQSW